MSIPPGKFMMGCSPGDDECELDEKPPHEVNITKAFWIGQTEVTQEAHQKITGKNPSNFKGAKLPVDSITWNDAWSYCQAAGMRLPTEAEWEHAARAGSEHSRYGDIATIAWYDENSGSETHEVARKAANAWGLCDMLGNVWEWTLNVYAAQPTFAVSDPTGPSSDDHRALRGGSLYGRPRYQRASRRDKRKPGANGTDVGVRCVAELL